MTVGNCAPISVFRVRTWSTSVDILTAELTRLHLRRGNKPRKRQSIPSPYPAFSLAQIRFRWCSMEPSGVKLNTAMLMGYICFRRMIPVIQSQSCKFRITILRSRADHRNERLGTLFFAIAI
jgi:hypothetical protein